MLPLCVSLPQHAAARVFPRESGPAWDLKAATARQPEKEKEAGTISLLTEEKAGRSHASSRRHTERPDGPGALPCHALSCILSQAPGRGSPAVAVFFSRE